MWRLWLRCHFSTAEVVAVVNEGGGGEEEEASLSIAKCVHFTWSRRRRLRQLLVLFHEDTGQGRPTWLKFVVCL